MTTSKYHPGLPIGPGMMIHKASNFTAKELLAMCREYKWTNLTFKAINEGGKKPNLRRKDIAVFQDPIWKTAGIDIIPMAFVLPRQAARDVANAYRRVCQMLPMVKCLNVNAERSWEANTMPRARSQKIYELGENLQDFLPKFAFILSTFCPRGHRSFPYAHFLKWCHALQAQAYSSDPVGQIRVTDKFLMKYPDIQSIPALRAYLGDGISTDAVAAEKLSKSLAEVEAIGLESWQYWQLDGLKKHPAIMQVLSGAAAGRRYVASSGLTFRSARPLSQAEISRVKAIQRWFNSYYADTYTNLKEDGWLGKLTVAALLSAGLKVVG